jgi:DinB superfamily
MDQSLQYPIGKFQAKEYSDTLKKEWLSNIKTLPQELELVVQNLDAFQLDTAYREGGWTVKQLVHHIADSHMNAYCRFKLGLTEDNPVIKTYDEKMWANLADVSETPINLSVTLLHALHARWHKALENLTVEDWNKTVFHPERKTNITLWNLLGTYSWHGKHHVAHIQNLITRQNWK